MSSSARFLGLASILAALPLASPAAQGALVLDGTYGFGSIFAEYVSSCNGTPSSSLVGSDVGNLTFFPDGTYSLLVTGQLVCDSGATFNLSSSGPGTYVVDEAGRITLDPGTSKEEHLVVRPDLQVVVTGKDTSVHGPYLAIALRLSSAMDESVLAGTYRFARLALANDGSGTRGEVWSGTMSFDGAGSVGLDYLAKSVAPDGTTTLNSSSSSETYSVADSGVLELGGMKGAVSSDGEVFALIDSLGQEVALFVGVPLAGAAQDELFGGEWASGKMQARLGLDPALPRFCSELADMWVTAPTSSYTLSGIEDCEDSSGESVGPSSGSGAYTLAPDGALSILEAGTSVSLGGAIDPTGTLGFIADTSLDAELSLAFLVRKGAMPSPFGSATPGSGGLEPTLASSGGFAYLGNPDFRFEIDQALSGAAAFLGKSIAPSAGLPLLGGTLWLDPATLFGVEALALTGAGGASVPAPIPLVPALDGLDIHAQAAVLDPGAGPFGFSMTPGLRVPLRR